MNATISGERAMTELSSPPVASSVHRPWSGMVAQLYHWKAGGSVVSPVVDHDIIAMRVTGSVRLDSAPSGGSASHAHATPGNVTIHARGFESRWSWDRPGAIVVVRATQDLLAAASEALARHAGPVELQNCFGARDAFIEPIMNLFALELRRPPHPAQELISGGLSAALIAHLIQRFNTRQASGTPDPGGLEPTLCAACSITCHTSAGAVDAGEPCRHCRREPFHFARRFRRSTGQTLVEYLKRIDLQGAQEARSVRGLAGGLANWQVRRVTSHMLDHLDRDVTLDELAKLVDLSRAHFCTAFRLAVGLTPGEWAIQKRIERARQLLADSTLVDHRDRAHARLHALVIRRDLSTARGRNAIRISPSDVRSRR